MANPIDADCDQRQRPIPARAMSSPRRGPGINASCAWRDALGPGYAVGLTEQMATFVAAKAAQPYRCS